MESRSGYAFQAENKEKSDGGVGCGEESVTGFYLDQINVVTIKSIYVSIEMGQSLRSISYGIIWDFYL